MVNRIQNGALLNESGAEIIEIVFGLVFAIGLGAALLLVQNVINDMLDSAGDGAAKAFNAMAEGGAVDLDEVTYGDAGAGVGGGAGAGVGGGA